MKNAINFVIAYGMWIVDNLLTFWLAFLIRTDFLGVLSLFYKKEQWQYPRQVNFADKVLILLLGLSWIAYVISMEEYFREGVLKENLMKRFSKITGPILLAIFVFDLTLYGLQGFGNWLRWLILAGELALGISLLATYLTKYSTSTPGHK